MQKLHHPLSLPRRGLSDVIVDRISMVLMQRRTLSEWIRESGGTLEGLMSRLRQKIVEIDSRS